MSDAHTQALVMSAMVQLGRPATVGEIAHCCGILDQRVRNSLRALERAGIASRDRSHGPWSLVASIMTATASGTIKAGDMVCRRADGSVASATKAESHERAPDLAMIATGQDNVPTGKKPLPWWHGNPSTRTWWERKRLKDKELRAK